MLSKASGSSFPALFYSKKRLETKISFYIWSDTYKDSTSMKHYLYILFLLFLLLPPIHAQKVGLVLSGGGAKGLTHIGIIRALEENGIPIDYIAGTSMGAIVGSLYAMGYSPDEMEALLKSDDFKRWYSGNVDISYIHILIDLYIFISQTERFISIYQDHFFCFNISDKVKLTSNWYDSIWIICIRCRHIVT